MLAFIPETDFADESLNGYLLRLAEENFLGSTTALLRPIGIRLKAQYSPRELQAIAEYHGLELQQLQRLAMADDENDARQGNQQSQPLAPA